MKFVFLYMKKNIKENRTGCGFRETVIQEGKFLTIFRKLIVTMSELTLPNTLQAISKPV